MHVYNKTFARLYAANKWAPHLRFCCVSRVSCVPCMLQC